MIQPNDRVVVIGSTESQAKMVRERYGLTQLLHHNPPMGFIHDSDAVESCLRFVEAASPFRFCLIAVGDPQGVMVAHQLGVRERARGLAFIIGASIDFVTGKQRRAPLWMQHSGLEWLHRLLGNPRHHRDPHTVDCKSRQHRSIGGEGSGVGRDPGELFQRVFPDQRAGRRRHGSDSGDSTWLRRSDVQSAGHSAEGRHLHADG